MNHPMDRADRSESHWIDETFENRVRFGLRGRSVYSTKSAFQQIDIVDTDQFGRALLLDGVYMTSERDEFLYHEMLVHPPMLACEKPERVLIIGGGDGGTLRRVLEHESVKAVTMVEIDSEVVAACRRHLPSVASGAWDDPRLDLRYEDGVAFAANAAPRSFDVVLLDGSDPVGPSAGLFDRTFYESCRALLDDQGVFAAQSETPYYMREVFLDIVRCLREVFGRADPYFGSVPLYGAGAWTWTMASKGIDPLAFSGERAEAVGARCRYYSPEIHRAAFAVPAEFARALTGEGEGR